ncbi:hypothetical protein [Pseudomonas serbica]|jgi:hypothetical protein|uniref:hypothetical protein n=1 Tax=Pseudomonas serbica TaxID=2965074 RepID=UPI00237B7C07|nr:hypothetical protein [Pseudomonas serbica]
MTAELIVMDVESSGSDKDAGSFPISIGIAGPADTSWSWYICPLEDWTHWDSAAEDDHGLSRDLLIAEGQDPYILSRILNRLFGGKVLLVSTDSKRDRVHHLFSAVQVKLTFEVLTLAQRYDGETVQNMYDEILETQFPRVAKEDVKILYKIIQSLAP